MVDIIRRTPSVGLSTFDREPFRVLRELMRLDPFRELGSYAEQVAGFEPRFDVKETEKGYLVTGDLPGVKEEDLDISLHGNRLEIRGSREAEKEEKTDTYYMSERTYGTFARSFALPDDADIDSIKADLKDGVLQVSFGKKPEAQVRRISIGAKEQKKS